MSRTIKILAILGVLALIVIPVLLYIEIREARARALAQSRAWSAYQAQLQAEENSKLQIPNGGRGPDMMPLMMDVREPQMPPQPQNPHPVPASLGGALPNEMPGGSSIVASPMPGGGVGIGAMPAGAMPAGAGAAPGPGGAMAPGSTAPIATGELAATGGGGMGPQASGAATSAWNPENSFFRNQVWLTITMGNQRQRGAIGLVLSNPVNPADTFVLAPVGAFEPINEKVNGRMIERRPTLATIEDYLYATNSSAMPGGAGMPGMAMGSMGGGFMRGMAYANIKLEKDGLVGFPGTGLVALRCSVGWQPQEILGDLPEVKVGDKVFAVNRDDQPTSSTITKRTAYEVTEINAQAGLASADGKSPVDMLTGLIKVVGTAPQPGAGMLLCDEKGVPIGVVVISSRSPTEGAATGAPAPPSPKSYAYVLPMQRVFDLSLPASGKEPANIDVRGYLPGSGKAATSRADQSQADQEFLSLLQADIEIYRSLEGEKRDEQKTVIAKKLEAHFEAQQARRSQEVADLALRLEQLKATTQKRGELKSELMQKQLEKILQP